MASRCHVFRFRHPVFDNTRNTRCTGDVKRPLSKHAFLVHWPRRAGAARFLTGISDIPSIAGARFALVFQTGAFDFLCVRCPAGTVSAWAVEGHMTGGLVYRWWCSIEWTVFRACGVSFDIDSFFLPGLSSDSAGHGPGVTWSSHAAADHPRALRVPRAHSRRRKNVQGDQANGPNSNLPTLLHLLPPPSLLPPSDLPSVSAQSLKT